MTFDPTKFVTEKMKQLIVATASPDKAVADKAMDALAQALSEPLREGIFSGDIVSPLFERVPITGRSTKKYPLDFVAPGTEGDFTAFTIPKVGYIPQNAIEGDEVRVPTYDVGNAVDWPLFYADEADWDIVSRAYEAYEAGFTKKLNDDGWHTILAAGVDRNIVVFDADATAGQFTKRLISLMKVVMRRNGGGNSTSQNRKKLTHVYLSPEAIEDIRDWGVDQVDEVTRREIFVAEDGSMNKIFGVFLVDLDELGEGMQYQLYFTNELSGNLAASDVELVVGMDLSSRNKSFVMPVRTDRIATFRDDTLHRQRRAGIYGWLPAGFGVLDNRNVILASL